MEGALANLARVGISDLWDAGQKTIEATLRAYLGKKTLDHAAFSKYIELANPAAPVLYAAIRAVVAEQNGLSTRVVAVIRTGIEALKHTLSQATSVEECREVRQQIRDLIGQARDEADRERRFKIRALYIASGFGLLGTAILVGRVCPPAQRPLLAKGIWLIRHAFI